MKKKTISSSDLNLALQKEQEIWLYSYADLITNLLAFFIMMLTMIKGGPETREKIERSLAKVVGREIPAENQELTTTVSQMVKNNHLENQLSFAQTKNGISLVFSGGIFFETLSAQLTPEAKEILNKVLPVMKSLKPGVKIDVEGHADSRPVAGTKAFPSNWELSAARAGAVVRYLVENGVDAQKLRAVGYSDTQPISSDLQLNRRVVINIGEVKR